MSHDALLPHIAKVYRASGSDDRFGQPVNPMDSDVAVHTTFPCRLVTAKSGGVLDDERTVFVFEDRFVMHAGPGVDCAEDDAVEIVDAAGGEVLPRSRVKLRRDVWALDELHHTEFDLEARRGPRNG